jgi:hypothetical protein
MRSAPSRLLVATVSLLGCSLAQAQYGFTPNWAFNGAPEAQMLHQNYVMQQIANGTYLKGTKSIKSSSASVASAKPAPLPSTVRSAAPLTFEPVSPPVAPAALARAYPAAQRTQAEQVFSQSLQTWHGLESQFGLRRNDMGGALAAFVAGNYAAYRDQPLPDALFKPLVRQMQAALLHSGALERVDAAQKQVLYEHLAILGTWMLATREALQKQPDARVAANMKAAARGYLQQALGLDAERMRLTDQGLVVD